MARKVLWPVLIVGLALVVAPFAMSLPSRAAAGERMIGDFQPIMQPANVQKTADYYYDVFVPLGKVAPAMNEAAVQKFDGYLKGFGGVSTDAGKLLPALAQAMHLTPAETQALMQKQFPSLAAMLAGLPQMQRDFQGLLTMMGQNTGIFARVPAGLAHYEPLVTTMQGNVGDYESIAGLPDFRLFTWFFVVPGALLALLAGWGLWTTREEKVPFRTPRPTPAA